MNPNTITISLGSDATPEDIARAILAVQAFTGQSDVELSLPAAGGATISATNAAGDQANLELDAEGLPHDPRIHASTKTQTKAGIWTKLKGVDDKVRDAVVAELRQRFPEPTSANPPAPANLTIPGITVPGIQVPAITPKSEYQKLCDYIASNVGNGPLTQAIVDETFKANSTSLGALTGNEENSKLFREAFESFVAQNS